MPAAAPSGASATAAVGPQYEPSDVADRYWQATRAAAAVEAQIRNSNHHESSPHLSGLRRDRDQLYQSIAALEEYAQVHQFWELVLASKPRIATVRPAGQTNTVARTMKTVASVRMPSTTVTPKEWGSSSGPGKVETRMDESGSTRMLDRNPLYSSFVGHESTHITNMDRGNFRSNPHAPGLRRAISRHGSFATAVALETLFGGLARDALAGEFLFDPLGFLDKLAGVFRRKNRPNFLREDLH